MTAVAASKRARSALHDDDGGAALPGAERRAEAGIAAAKHRDVKRLSQASL